MGGDQRRLERTEPESLTAGIGRLEEPGFLSWPGNRGNRRRSRAPALMRELVVGRNSQEDQTAEWSSKQIVEAFPGRKPWPRRISRVGHGSFGGCFGAGRSARPARSLSPLLPIPPPGHRAGQSMRLLLTYLSFTLL
jgi:hypothetical protein